MELFIPHQGVRVGNFECVGGAVGIFKPDSGFVEHLLPPFPKMTI